MNGRYFDGAGKGNRRWQTPQAGHRPPARGLTALISLPCPTAGVVFSPEAALAALASYLQIAGLRLLTPLGAENHVKTPSIYRFTS